MANPQKTPQTQIQPTEAPAIEQAQPAQPSYKIGDKAWIAAVKGEMVHMFTNDRFTQRPIKVVIDGYTFAQLEAKKLCIALDE